MFSTTLICCKIFSTVSSLSISIRDTSNKFKPMLPLILTFLFSNIKLRGIILLLLMAPKSSFCITKTLNIAKFLISVIILQFSGLFFAKDLSKSKNVFGLKINEVEFSCERPFATPNPTFFSVEFATSL